MNKPTILDLVSQAVQACKTDEEKSALINHIMKTAVGEGLKAGIPEWFSFYGDSLEEYPGGIEGHEEMESMIQAHNSACYG